MKTQPVPTAEVQTWHYQAGPLHLSVDACGDTRELPPCAAEAAVVLDGVGELLDALRLAGLTPHDDWQWLADGTSSPARGAQAQWCSGDLTATLALPWSALRALPEPPHVPGLSWQDAAAEWLWAQWRLNADEVAMLEVSGLLLLEPSTTPRLRAQGEDPPMGDLPHQLVARWERPLPLSTLLGWDAPPPPTPAECLLFDATRPEAVLARGRLIPWGSGQAFLVEAR